VRDLVRARAALLADRKRARPRIGLTLRRRQHDAAPHTLARSWQPQRQLHTRYKTMAARGKPAAVAIIAMARELAGSR